MEISAAVIQSMDAVIPKYFTVKMYLVGKIKDGVFKPGDPLPTENQLAEMFSFSRITVRRALSELVSEGYVYKIQGKGTFVAQNIPNLNPCATPRSESYSKLIKNCGFTPRRQCVYFEYTECDEENAGQLKISPGDPILAIRRIYYAGEIPSIVVDSVINLKVLKGIEEYNITPDTLFSTVSEKLLIQFNSANRIVMVSEADVRLSKYLNVPCGFPLLQNKYVSVITESDIPWESAKAYYRTDVLHYLPDL